jgi:4-hydroxy-4-methyl-2-oxoglutarate aldolase
MIGDLLATQAQARGVAGAIVDGAVRDTARLREMAFPTWARRASALGASKAHPGWVNVPVPIGHAMVRPGDVVCADDDGIIVVQRDDIGFVVANAATRVDAEADKRQAYRRGELSLDLSDLRRTLERLGVSYSRDDDEDREAW